MKEKEGGLQQVCMQQGNERVKSCWLLVDGLIRNIFSEICISVQLNEIGEMREMKLTGSEALDGHESRTEIEEQSDTFPTN